MVTQERLSELLHEGEVVVTFTKQDGSTRVMRATQNGHLIPAEKHPTSTTTTKGPAHTLRVFDCDIQEWRSFRYESVTAVDVSRLPQIDPLTATIAVLLFVAGWVEVYMTVWGRS